MQEDLDLPDLGPPDPWPSPLPAPPAPRPAEHLPELAVWALLVSAVVGIFVFTMSRPAPEAADSTAGRMELRFQAKYVVGVNALFGKLGGGLAENLHGQLLDQLRTLATTPAEQLCVVPLVAELEGVEAALEEISRLRQEDGLPEDVVQDLALLERLYGEPDSMSKEERVSGDERVGEEERAGFLKRRQWFARLALSQGAADDAGRRALVEQSIRVALLMIGLVMGVGVGALAGCGLLVVGAVLISRQRWVMLYEPRRSAEASVAVAASTAIHRLPYLETVLVFILAMVLVIPLVVIVVSRLTGSEDVPLVLTVLTAPAVLWPLARRLSWPDVRRAYGWHRGQGVWREIGCGLLGYVAGAPLLVIGVLISVVLSSLVEKTPHHPLMDDLPGSGVGGVLMIYLLACVSAPLMEETIFRGGLYHYLRSRWGMVASAFIVSVIFAFIHPQGILGVPPLIALAMILAFIREWRGSLIASIAVHAVHNGLATTLLLVLLR